MLARTARSAMLLMQWLAARYRALGRNARLYLLSNLLQAATTGAVVILYTLYLSALGYHKDFIGLVLLAGTLGGGLGIIPANALVNRLGYRAMLIWSDLIGGVAIFVQIVLPTAPIILITSLGVGASVAVVIVVNTPLLTTYSTPAERTALLGINGALNFLAGVVGTLLGGFLPEVFRSAAVATSPLLHALGPLLVARSEARALELAMLAAGALAVPSIIPIILMREERAAVQAGRDAGGTGGGAAQSGGSHRTPLREQIAAAVRAARALMVGVVGRFTVTQALLGFGAGLFIPFLSNYFVEHLHTSTRFYSVLAATIAGAVALANLLAAPVARRFGRVRGAVLAQLLSLVFLLALGAFPLVALAAGAMVLRSSLMALTGPPLQAYYMEAVPEQSRVLASSVYNISYQVIWALGAAAGGVLINAAGYAPAFFAAAPFYAASALLIAFWFGGRASLRPASPLPLAAGVVVKSEDGAARSGLPHAG
jgi:MFS family permease